jgi:hypothetical protein
MSEPAYRQDVAQRNITAGGFTHGRGLPAVHLTHSASMRTGGLVARVAGALPVACLPANGFGISVEPGGLGCWPAMHDHLYRCLSARPAGLGAGRQLVTSTRARPSAYACIPAGFTGGVVSVGNGAKVEGVSVLDSAGLWLHNFGLELTDPSTPSVINNINVGSHATFTVDEGVTVDLTGQQASAGLTGFGSAALAGAGTIVIDSGTTLGFGVGISGTLTVEVDPGATVQLKSGYFDSANGARFLNSGTVVIAPAQTAGTIDDFGENSVGTFVNEHGGTIVDPAGGAPFQFQVPFENQGRVSVAAGQTLTFSHSGTASGGTFSIAPKGKLELDGGTFQLAHAKLSGTGTFDFQLGTIILGGQKLANVAQCATTQGAFTVTKTWVSAACTSNGQAVMQGRSSTIFAHGVQAKVGCGDTSS